MRTTPTTRISVINNRIDRLPTSAHFPPKTVPAEVRRPGECRPSPRVHRVVVPGDSKAAGLMTEADFVSSLSCF